MPPLLSLCKLHAFLGGAMTTSTSSEHRNNHRHQHQCQQSLHQQQQQQQQKQPTAVVTVPKLKSYTRSITTSRYQDCGNNEQQQQTSLRPSNTSPRQHHHSQRECCACLFGTSTVGNMCARNTNSSLRDEEIVCNNNNNQTKNIKTGPLPRLTSRKHRNTSPFNMSNTEGKKKFSPTSSSSSSSKSDCSHSSCSDNTNNTNQNIVIRHFAGAPLVPSLLSKSTTRCIPHNSRASSHHRFIVHNNKKLLQAGIVRHDTTTAFATHHQCANQIDKAYICCASKIQTDVPTEKAYIARHTLKSCGFAYTLESDEALDARVAASVRYPEWGSSELQLWKEIFERENTLHSLPLVGLKSYSRPPQENYSIIEDELLNNQQSIHPRVLNNGSNISYSSNSNNSILNRVQPSISDSTTASSIEDPVITMSSNINNNSSCKHQNFNGTDASVAPLTIVNGIRSEMREAVVHWMSKVTVNMKWKRSTFFIAVHALDSYLAATITHLNKACLDYECSEYCCQKDKKHEREHNNSTIQNLSEATSTPIENSKNSLTTVPLSGPSPPNEDLLPLLSTAALFLGVAAEEEHVHAHRIKSFVKEVPNLTSIHQVFVQQLDFLSCLTAGLLITRTPEDFLYYFLANLKISQDSRFNCMYALLQQPIEKDCLGIVDDESHILSPIPALRHLIECILIITTCAYEKGIYGSFRGSHLVAACLVPLLANIAAVPFCKDIQLLLDVAKYVFKFSNPNDILHIMNERHETLRQLINQIMTSAYHAISHKPVIVQKFLLFIASYSISYYKKFSRNQSNSGNSCSESLSLELEDTRSIMSGTPQIVSSRSTTTSQCRTPLPITSREVHHQVHQASFIHREEDSDINNNGGDTSIHDDEEQRCCMMSESDKDVTIGSDDLLPKKKTSHCILLDNHDCEMPPHNDVTS